MGAIKMSKEEIVETQFGTVKKITQDNGVVIELLQAPNQNFKDMVAGLDAKNPINQKSEIEKLKDALIKKNVISESDLNA